MSWVIQVNLDWTNFVGTYLKISRKQKILKSKFFRCNSQSWIATKWTPQSPKKWSKIVSIPLKSKLHHLAFRPNNGARDNVLAVATDTELAVFKICSEV